jgi:hypothetical protein
MPSKKSTSRKSRKRLKKTVRLDAPGNILGAPTESEPVDRAFDESIFEHRVSAGLDRLAEAGGLPSVDPEA